MHAWTASAGRVVMALMLLAASGCRTWRPSPVDLSDAGWTVIRGQGLWRPAGQETELAGELLVAIAPNEVGYLQFNKGPVMLAEARADGERWLVRFPAVGRTVSGRGVPPGRLGWSQLLRVVLDQPTATGWRWSGSIDGRWSLEDPTSGERLEGTRLP